MRLSNYLSLAGLEAHVKLVSRIAIVLSFFSSGEARAQAPFDSTVQAVLTPMMRPAESPGGFLNTDPALRVPPG